MAREKRADPSGRFVLRIDAALHRTLREDAVQAGLSLNEYCARKLALPEGSVSGPAADAVRRASTIAGRSLVGIVAFGSWARGDLVDSSDVDLLIVLDGSVSIDRRLYREWDRSPLSWESHPIEPHFVHLPPPDGRLSSVWAEVAVDGVVLFERGFVISRHLVEIRQEIAAGRIVRRMIHGQPYWVEAA